MTMGPATIERRKTFRHRVGLPGLISLPTGEVLDCVVTDISLSGACITGPAELPGRFDLQVKSSPEFLKCEVIRRARNVVGVYFVRGEGFCPAPPKRPTLLASNRKSEPRKIRR